MSEHETEAVEGVEMQPGDVPADAVPPEPFDPARHAQESADHDLFLQTYQPVITRLPQALADERAEQTAAEEAQVAADAASVKAAEEAEAQRLAAIDATSAEAAEYREAHYPGT